MVSVPVRRGSTLIEVITSTLILGLAVFPLFATFRTQMYNAKWSGDRLMAIGLADDVLNYLTAKGYDWIRSRLNPNAVVAWNFPNPGLNAGNPNWADSTSGSTPNMAPNPLNPILGGPRPWPAGLFVPGTPGPQDRYWEPLNDAAGNPDWNGERTFRVVNRFQRRVQISYPKNFPFPQPGSGDWPNNPSLLVSPLQVSLTTVRCLMVKVWIQQDGTGTSMSGTVSPGLGDGRLQVVTYIGRHY